MRIFAIPILRNRWAYYCHSTAPTTSQLTKAVDWSSKKWEQLGTADPSTWKRKLYDRGNHFMNQLDYQEWFLKNVPIQGEIQHPPEKVFCIIMTWGISKTDLYRHMFFMLHIWMVQQCNRIWKSYYKSRSHITKSTCTTRLIGYPLHVHLPLYH